MERAMIIGNKNRSTGETLMNKDSSRSHSLFTIKIEMSEADEKGNEVFYLLLTLFTIFFFFQEIYIRKITLSRSCWK